VRFLFGDRIVLYPRFHAEARYGPFKIRRLRPSTTFQHQSIDGRWAFQINKQGFRDDHDYEYAKRPGCLRVLCLGDSHTEGFECTQTNTYAKVLERCGKSRGRDVEVLNAAFSGAGTAEELVLLENEGIRYHPDYVVVGFFANDPDDNVKSDLFRLQDGRLITNKFVHLPGVRLLEPLNDFALTRWLSQHSFAYSLVLNRVWDAMKARLSWERAQAIPNEYAVAPVSADQRIRQYQTQLTSALFERMHAFCRSHGIRLFVVDIPQRESERVFGSSFSPALAATMATNCDLVLWSTNLFADRQNKEPLFVPHGQWHIAEPTHARIGMELARAILADAAASTNK